MLTKRRALGLVGAVLLNATSFVTPLSAEASQKRCYTNASVPGGVVCEGADRLTPVRAQTRTPATAHPHRELWRPVLAEDVDGGTCVTIRTMRLPSNPGGREDRQSEMQLVQYLQSFPMCEAAELPAVTTPEMEAAAFFRRIELPVPEPHVAPGRLLVGLESFLETGAPRSQTYGPVDTPFGPLTLTATARIYVDWDDPHDDVAGEHGPYDAEPGPYPDGGIRHVYQYDGWYRIAVRYVWTATWAIGDVGGTIGGVETTGTYPAPGFEAFSRQAVG